MKKYDETDRSSIYAYAKILEGKTFNDVIENHKEEKFILKEEPSYGSYSRKGGLGELIEHYFFGYLPDNESRADFPLANLELKVTPFRQNKNGTYSAKERLIIGMINYNDIVNTNFFESSLWSKLENILLIYYKWDEKIEDRLDYIIKFVYLYSPEKEDLKIIINDFNIIKRKVINGEAHLLSEGDTMYLGAATKSSNSSVLTEQPFSTIKAKPRAFALKNSYMTWLLRNKIIPEAKRNEKIICEDDNFTNFEQYIISKINQYKGMSADDLFKKFLNDSNPKNKNRYSQVVMRILGVNTSNAAEFEKANIVVKTIRVEENDSIIESMSFPTFKVKELIKQEWENSDIYNYFSETKFLFVTFKKNEGIYHLDKSFFWNMPVKDLENTLREEWLLAQKIFINGVKFTVKKNKNGYIVSNNLPKLSNTEILHVRNHSAKSAYLINGIKYGNGTIGRDTDELPNGDHISKQCFWLNNKYIKKIIKKSV